MPIFNHDYVFYEHTVHIKITLQYTTPGNLDSSKWNAAIQVIPVLFLAFSVIEIFWSGLQSILIFTGYEFG